jgi:hypothetical protein
MKKTIATAALSLAALALTACNGNGPFANNRTDTGGTPVLGQDTSGPGAYRTDDSTYPRHGADIDNSSGMYSGGTTYRP